MSGDNDNHSEGNENDSGSDSGSFDYTGMPPQDDEDTDDIMRDAERKAAEGIKFKREREERENEMFSEIRSEYPDILERAKQINCENIIKYPVLKKTTTIGQVEYEPTDCDENRLTILHALFGPDDKDCPHYDTFSAKYINFDGTTIEAKQLRKARWWLEIFRTLGMQGETAECVLKMLRLFAANHERDSLIEQFAPRIPKWDGVPRLESYMIAVFALCDTPLNRLTGRYFWTSLYARVMMKGPLDAYGKPTAPEAPIAIMLLGEQGTGKSLFWKRVVEVIMNDNGANVERFRFDMDPNRFLRNITGKSVIMSCNEMTGFSNSNMELVKDFLTETSDTYDEKFELSRRIQRRWVSVGTGNKYEGFQRDTTGNRRMIPYFVNQCADDDGSPLSDWKREAFRARFNVERMDVDVMQLMAEAHEWFNENGNAGYDLLVTNAISAVSTFSDNEMAHDSGTVANEELDIYLEAALYFSDVYISGYHDEKWSGGSTGGMTPKCVCIMEINVKSYVRKFARTGRINFKLLANKLLALGGQKREKKIANRTVWEFQQFKTAEGFRKWLLERNNMTHEKMEQCYGINQSGGGF